MSSCTNHLCHLQDMPRANIPVSYYSKNITHVVLRHIRVLTYLASFQKGEPFQSQTTEISPGLWPFSPTAHLGFNRNRWVHWEVNKMTRLLLKPLITNLVYSIWLAHQHKHKSGKQNKNLAQESVTAYSLCCWGHCSLISWALWLSLLGQRGKMQAMLWERGDKRKGTQKNPRANQQ